MCHQVSASSVLNMFDFLAPDLLYGCIVAAIQLTAFIKALQVPRVSFFLVGWLCYCRFFLIARLVSHMSYIHTYMYIHHHATLKLLR